MKLTGILLFILIPLVSNAQLFFGLSAGGKNQVFNRVHIEYKESLTRVEVAYLTDFHSNYLQVKMGFGKQINQWGFYGYIPYLNYEIGKKYNTPFCFEIFYSNWASFNVDIYKNTIVPSIRIKTIIVK